MEDGKRTRRLKSHFQAGTIHLYHYHLDLVPIVVVWFFKSFYSHGVGRFLRWEAR